MVNKDTLVKGQKIYKRYPDGQIQGFVVSSDPYPRIGVKREGDVYSVFREGVTYCSWCGMTLDYEEGLESYE